MPSPRGFCVTYASARRLDADHAAYLTHGGLLLGIDDAEPAPGLKEPIEVRIVHGERTFNLSGEAGHRRPGRGLMVSFEGHSEDVRDALDAYMVSDGFRTQKRAEPPGEAPSPAVQPLPDAELEEIDTDPHVPAPVLTDTQEEVPSALPEPPVEVEAEATLAPPPPNPGTFGPPGPGEEYFTYVAKFTTVTPFLAPLKTFDETGVFPVAYEDDGLAQVHAIVQLRLTLPGRNLFEMWGRIHRVESDTVHIAVDRDTDTYRKAVLYPTTVSARKRLEREATLPPEPPTSLRIRQEIPKENVDRMPIRRRLARMGMDDKINLALSGGREERMAIAMDGNKAIHHYLLKNAKITLDEIAFMARLPSFNPDVLDKIAENPAYTQNPTITKALVYNPRTPVKTAIRLLDRLPRSEVMNLAKRTTMNQRLVMAAKKKVERRSR